MKEQFLKMIEALTEDEILNICEAVNEQTFEYGWDKSMSKEFNAFIEWCWKDKE